MSHAGNACGSCYRNCFLMHKKKQDNPSMSSSFFKIMFGQKYDSFLAVPPAFTKKIKSLAGRKIILEDCSRRRWDVLVSNVKGSLTLRDGWNNFVVDHDIEMGDLLVFYYFRDEHFLVEIFGRSGCQKRFQMTNKNRATEATRSSIPSKRPSDSSSKQSAQKRHFSSSSFSESDIYVIPRRSNVRAMKEPSVMARKVSSRGHILERSPSLDVTVLEPSFTSNREKNCPKMFPVDEAEMDPCLMTCRDTNRPRVAPRNVGEPSFRASQEKNRPKVVPVDETLMEPCFVSSRDKDTASEYDRDCLFDLSAFEMPDKKSTVDREEETYYIPDLPAYDLPENETDADKAEDVHVQGNTSSQLSAKFQNTSTGIAGNETTTDRNYVGDDLLDMFVFEMPENEYANVIDKGHLQENLHGQESDNYQNAETDADKAEDVHVQGNTSSQLSAKFQNTSTGIAGNETTTDRNYVGDDLLDMSVFEMPENEYANVIDKGHLQENLHGQESDNYQNAEIEDGSADDPNLTIFEKFVEELVSQSRKAELPRHDGAPLTGSSPTADLPIDSITPIEVIGKQETTKYSAVSGEKTRLSSQEMKVCKQEFIGNAQGESSLAASFSTGEQNYGDLGATSKSSIQMMNDKGENMRRIDQEVREVKRDIRGDAMADCCYGDTFSFDEQTKTSSRKFAGNISPTVKIEADVTKIVKLEPVDFDTSSEIDVKVTCLIPPGIENFLVLPKPLQVAVRVDKRRVKPKHQLVLLQDPAGRDWPVIYHNKSGPKVLTSGWKSFMKVNNIQPGDECIFTAKHSSEESLFTVQVVRHN